MSTSRIVTAGPGLHVGDYMLAQTVDRGKVISRDPKVIQGHRLEKLRVAGKNIAVGDGLAACACDRLDISWLPFCTDEYQISANVHDYVIIENYSVIASIPNRNLDCMTYNELTAWRPMHGMPCWSTFRGKAVCKDHDNADPKKAVGVIFDATMTPLTTARNGKTIWAVKTLKGFDRSKDSRLANLVQQRNRVGHSMGCLVERTVCSLPWCRFVSDGITTCEHVQGGAGKGKVIRDFVVAELLIDFGFVEDSSVEDPANVISLTDYIWELNKQ